MGAGTGHLTSWGHSGVGAEAEKSMSELGLDKVSSTEGMRVQEGIQRKLRGEMVRR